MTTVKATKRNNKGTGASRRLRKAGQVPAIMYGKDRKPVNITLDQNQIFYAVNQESFHTNLIHIDLEGEKYDVIIRDFQMHAFKPLVLHVDFQIVDTKKPIRVKVPLRFLNTETAQSVKLYGASIFRLANTVEVLALPDKIPQQLEVDVQNIQPGQILHASDIKLPKAVELVSLKKGVDLPIVSATGSSKVK